MSNIVRTAFALQTLTPLHIGSGEMYQPGLDYQIENGQLSLINRNRLFTVLEGQDIGMANKITGAIEGKSLFSELRAQSLLDKVLSYRHPFKVVGGPPREIRAQIRDGNGLPLLPGSSFKGALRTVIVAHLSRQPQHAQALKNHLQSLRDSNKFDPKYADLGYLKHLLGIDPNHNLLRILAIPDLYFDREVLAPLAIKTVRLTNGGKQFADKGFTMGAEAIKAGSSAVGTISQDSYLQRDEIRAKLGFREKLTVTELLVWIRQETSTAVDFELTFLAGKVGDYVDELLAFYQQLRQRLATLNENQAIFNLAWGSGWRGMTRAVVSEAELNAQNYRLRKVLQLATKYAGSFPFPKSRRVALTTAGNVPMGWVLLTLCDETTYRQTNIRNNSRLDNELQTIGNERQRVLAERVEKETRDAIEHERLALIERERASQQKQAAEAEALRKAELEALSPVDRHLLLLSRNELQEHEVVTLFNSLFTLGESDRVRTAQALRSFWQQTGKWSKKECSKKQWEKVEALKKVLGEG